MHVMYERLVTVDEYLAHQLVEVRCVPSTVGGYASECVDRRPVIHKRRSTTHRWRCRLSHMLLQKCSKMQHIFAYNGLPLGGGGYQPMTYILSKLSSS